MNSELLDKAKKVKAVIFDSDGVLFTGRVFMDAKGERLKERAFYDGQGISLLRSAGMRIAFVSAEATGFVEAVGEKFNNSLSAKNGKWPQVGVFTGHIGKEKISAVEGWLKEHGLDWSECAYMGDDVGDLEILAKVGLPAAPAQAEEIVKKHCVFIARRTGGDGAIRDLVNFILEAKGIDISKLSRK